ncbi:putative ApaG domain-containing protein [Helianthus anomalus]
MHQNLPTDCLFAFLRFPLLRPGKKEFVYESCTPCYAAPGSIEGSFTFILGRVVICLYNLFVDWEIQKEAPLRLKLLNFILFCQITSSDATVLFSIVTILP